MLAAQIKTLRQCPIIRQRAHGGAQQPAADLVDPGVDIQQPVSTRSVFDRFQHGIRHQVDAALNEQAMLKSVSRLRDV